MPDVLARLTSALPVSSPREKILPPLLYFRDEKVSRSVRLSWAWSELKRAPETQNAAIVAAIRKRNPTGQNNRCCRNRADRLIRPSERRTKVALHRFGKRRQRRCPRLTDVQLRSRQAQTFAEYFPTSPRKRSLQRSPTSLATLGGQKC